jgi:exportin-2 (importin alpha re-exporter)
MTWHDISFNHLFYALFVFFRINLFIYVTLYIHLQIHLMLGIAVKAESNQGVSSVNDKVNIMEFFTTHILAELQESNHSIRPMVKATAIKFASTFRNQFTKEHIAALMPLLISHLNSPSVVVHTYSAAAIEKFLVCKDNNAAGKVAKFGGKDIQPFLEPLFTGLFAIVDNKEFNENEYVMKCIMRCLSSARDDIIQVVQIVLEKLTAALFVVAKNPRNPQYNHYMFESIAVLVKAVCSKSPEHVKTFEGLLFQPFQQVLQMDVAEFTPYVFQIFAQLLEYRPANSGLGEAYGMLLGPFLTPAIWERRGNIPALTRLLQAYLMKGAAEIVSTDKLNGFLGVFQKLLASKASEISAFDLLGAVTQFVPLESLEPLLQTIFGLLFTRLQQGKSARYERLMTGYFAQVVGQYGTDKFLAIVDSMQNGLSMHMLGAVWLPRLSTDPPVRMDAKNQVVALTKIICETPSLLSTPAGKQVWMQALIAAAKILTSQESYLGASANDGDQDVEIGYDPTMSRLNFASRPPLDPFSSISNVAQAFGRALGKARTANAAVVAPLMQQGQQLDPKAFAMLEGILSKAGV